MEQVFLLKLDLRRHFDIQKFMKANSCLWLLALIFHDCVQDFFKHLSLLARQTLEYIKASPRNHMAHGGNTNSYLFAGSHERSALRQASPKA